MKRVANCGKAGWWMKCTNASGGLLVCVRRGWRQLLFEKKDLVGKKRCFFFLYFSFTIHVQQWLVTVSGFATLLKVLFTTIRSLWMHVYTPWKTAGSPYLPRKQGCIYGSIFLSQWTKRLVLVLCCNGSGFHQACFGDHAHASQFL